MTSFDHLFPPPGALGDAAAEDLIARFAAALAAGAPTELPDAAERIRQAQQKLASDSPLRRWAELVTLAQFGPAEIGRAVARFCDEAEAGATVCSAVWTTAFLCDSVRQVRRHGHRIPDDVLRRNGASRADLDQAEAAPTLRSALLEMSERAAKTLPPRDHLRRIAHPGLQRYVRREALLTARLLRRLRRSDPLAAEIGPTRSDQWLTSLSLLLHRAAAP